MKYQNSQSTDSSAALSKVRNLPSLRLAIRRLSLLTVLLALLSLTAAPRAGFAQANLLQTIPLGTTVNVCDSDECCLLFRFDDPVASDELDINLGGSATDTCFDWTCFAAQSTGTLTFTRLSMGMMQITTSSGSLPSPLFFYLCTHSNTDCTPACMDTFGWHSYSGGMPTGSGGDYLKTTCCTPNNPPCGCDEIRQTSSNTICVVKGGGSSATSVTLTFCPALSCSHTATLSGFPASWYVASWVDATPGCTTIIITGGGIGGSMSPCQQGCITLPNNCNKGRLTALSVSFSPTPNPCSWSKWGVLKMSGSGSSSAASPDGADQNYPNPLEASTGFKTTIPFTTSAKGVASIRIVDATGKEVLNDNEDVTYAGGHFFYFTADKLSAGTYYYTIEFPKGVVIASKTMLIVK